ncbi:major facilitator superfamily domain-containing protein 12 [Nomia melanderi]|uniref:major facilitator superfamily domain-containing protein 12 n=1 Tax=Nomia melanderi TaxID=2448451 RepID=UPI00130441E6|nr:major facilitator superfamily domain-containing protein 12-like [Nomia melanderi]XP_031833674.1 major facilitator superfamily domain-containing protein 12-like [Nomia melanderi]XP_031833683.1 major facilitator superfamily domain-containing protein 12-like [Nomia melanderi]XP_031833692.1 major facilitator superfamily domain-containing protein 12-like [Nomia melanderi]XP_031833699.1 major facilitator superfamily domain-containing protein 12-like [Nomia melanderi]XP_031833708.1 major facilitat
MENDAERSPLLERKVATSTKFAYALGHIFNDLTAAMWFSYTLIYFQRVALLKPIAAGALLLLGQIVDAFMTPVFGILVDRYWTQKVWHIIGSVLVVLSFPVIFGGFAEPSSITVMIVYVASISMFQTGWAAVQISHLSMIPKLTNSPLARADLTAIRYSAQVGAAVVVFIVTWIVLPTNEEIVVRLAQEDNYKFRDIVLTLTLIGLVTTILFHVFLKGHLLERHQLHKGRTEESQRLIDNPQNNRSSWFNTTILLRVAMLYVASRLFITLATVYLPLYIEETDINGKQALATVPLVSYVSSFMAALMLKHLNKSCGTKMCYFLGTVIGMFSAVITEFGGNSATIIYITAILIGAGSSITMVTALSVTAEIIGPRTERSAIVYSVVTFLDKVVTGLVVIFIEKWRCTQPELCPNYNRDTLALVCAISMSLGLATLISVSRCLT